MFGLTFKQLAIRAVIIVAIIALVLIAVHTFGIVIPAWVEACFWVIVVAIVIIAAIRLVASMWE